ncbi:AT-rich interactive domain-containing protein 4B-like isoform X2 [Acyrthosiphon pisum]|nr:AT-rich interactive domain-containing protein 4B-like isoform X2 [Acyrthosiphon pisum]|eukprot:XP_016663267.1 PREDICTED: AT-rich interactive domain-containing protein 4B-like isoform X2 [Acyrthosiphon pisum]
MVNMDEPPFLSVGTEVSAKFKGAFCEAKIRKISKSVKCKVQYSNGISTFITDDAVKGQLKVGATVNIKCSDKKELVPATIQKIQDFSEYTVVFNDGDIKCLKRTAICLKSGKYFSNSATPLRTTIIESCRVQTHKKSIGESGEEEALAMEKKDELPPHWDKDSLFDAHKMCISTDCEPIDSDNSDKESIEQKDHLVALLFKFMDDRGTPINQAPVINEKDVDLYKLFKVVNNCGGYNKVNKHKLWEFIAYKAGHEKESYISVKRCYEQYLHNFEDFYRKLGCTMMSHPIGERSRSRFSRSIIRNVYKALPSTSCATDKIKCAKNELNDKKNYNSDVIKKTAKAIKAEEKRVKNNEETSKKGDKKKEDIANSISRNRPSVKRNPEITETKDPVRNSKTKKELEEILKKEIKKEIDSEAVDDQIIEDKKLEKNIYMRNLFGKSMQKIIKKEKVVKEKSANTGLPGMRKLRGIKEQIKTVVKEIITPFKKSNRRVSHTQQDASNNENLDGEILKFTQSKTKEELPTKSRRVSVLSNLGDSVSVVQLTQPGLLVENLIKIKKEDGSEKKKTGRKKKDDKEEKVISNDIILTPVNIENVPFDKDTPVVVGDNLVVYYGNKEALTYEAKVISVCDIEGVKKYYVHYKGWNSRYDEWIDVMRIAYKTKDPEPGLEVDIADSSKSSPPEQKNVDLKKVPPTSSRTSSSVTPLRPNSNVKKSPFSSARPTRACTLTDRPLYNIDNSDLEGEFIVSEGSSKQYSRKKVIKLEPGVIIKTEPLDTDDQKKTQYPRIYPSKKVLMQRSAHLKPKSSVFKVQSNKFKEVDICKQALKQPFQPPSYSIKPNADNENVEAQNENKIDGIQIELKIAPNHCLSPKVKSRKK